MNYLSRFIIIVYSLLLMSSAHAVLRVEITRGVDSAAPIAIIPFEKSGLALPVSQDVAAIIAADLQRSGRFAPIEEGKLIATPQSAEAVNYKLWRIASIDHIVIGQVKVLAAGQYELQFRLVDVFRGEQVLGYKFNADDSNLRGMSHHISDLIYQQITGQRGAFDTKVAYITAERAAGKQPVYKLQVADTDGYSPQTVLTSTQPIMSPSWSPDGSRLAYVSFESGLSAIFIQNLLNRQRQKVASFEGINGAPVWSPDGARLAMTLSKSGNPDIYIMDLCSQKLQQLTTHWGIDTEPAWMPDGSEIIFTSSRSGKPQLYRKSLQNGRAKRITFEGDYNANAEVAPDGRSVAFVQGTANVFKIALLDLQTGFVNLLTDGALDESPSFAPNGSMILYATQANHRGELAAVSADGRFKQRLVLTEGDVREPSWAPFKKH